MILVRIFIPLIIIGALYFVFKKVVKEWKKADVEQKLEDIQEQEELYKKTTTVDFGEVKAEKKHINKVKDLDI